MAFGKRTRVEARAWEVTPSQAPLIEEAEAGLAADVASATDPAPAPTVAPSSVTHAASLRRLEAIKASLGHAHPAHTTHGGILVMADHGHRAVLTCKCGETLHQTYRDRRPGEER